MKRIRWVDIAKGIGILLVVLGHCQISETMLEIITSFHMPLFYFLAGYVYCPAKHSFSSFFKSRMKTILCPYVCFTVLSVVASFCRKLLGQEISLEIIFDKFVLIGAVESNRPLWFLRSLFVVQILFFFYQRFRKKQFSGYVEIYLMMILAFALDWNLWMRSVNGFVFYALGYYTKEARLMDHVRRLRYLVCVISAFVFCCAFVYSPESFSIGSNDHLISYVITTHAGSLFILSLSMCLEAMKIRVLDYLGKNSLVILCTHILVKDAISVFLKLFFKNYTYMDEISNGNAVLTTAIICIGSCVVAEIIKRYCPFVLGKALHRSKPLNAGNL